MPDWDEVSASCTPMPIFAGIHGRAPACDDILRRLVTLAWDHYVVETQALLDGDFRLTRIDTRIAELSTLIQDAVAEDPDSQTLAGWQSAVRKLGADVRAKRTYIEQKIAQ
jgi:hypothetical protein